MKFEKLHYADNVEICNLFSDAFNGSVDSNFINEMRRRLIDPSYLTYGYKDDNKIISVIHLSSKTPVAVLERIGVLSSYQNKGIGTSLIYDTIELISELNYTKIQLECLYNLRNFYDKIGFKKIGDGQRNKIKFLEMELKI